MRTDGLYHHQHKLTEALNIVRGRKKATINGGKPLERIKVTTVKARHDNK